MLAILMFYNKTSLNGKFRSNGFVLIAGGYHFHIVCHSIIHIQLDKRGNPHA